MDADRISPPVLVHRVTPAYPLALRQEGIGGTVLIRFIVDATGNVMEPEILDATHPAFGQSVLEAVKSWKFQPATLDGEPVNLAVRQEVPFTLHLAQR
jgi:protein TonB